VLLYQYATRILWALPTCQVYRGMPRVSNGVFTAAAVIRLYDSEYYMYIYNISFMTARTVLGYSIKHNQA
jgi:hypothetical protein